MPLLDAAVPKAAIPGIDRDQDSRAGQPLPASRTALGADKGEGRRIAGDRCNACATPAGGRPTGSGLPAWIAPGSWCESVQVATSPPRFLEGGEHNAIY